MGALNIGLFDVVDILLTGFLFYQIYLLLRGTAAIRILLGMLAIFLLYNLVQLLEMHLLSELLGSFISVGLVLLIIVFQQEIRRFLLVIGSATFTSRNRFLGYFLRFKKQDGTTTHPYEAVVAIAQKCRERKTGMLIVIERHDPLGSFSGSGHELDAKLSSILLESIFLKESPLHDGAVILAKNRVVAAGASLPISERGSLPSSFGFRHRSAAGIAERTDAVAVTVSEETGKIHVFADGQFIQHTPESLSEGLSSLLTA